MKPNLRPGALRTMATLRRMAEPVPVITREQIAERVAELAAQIDQDYREVDELVLIGVLKGAFVFLADLARALTIPRRVEFLAVSSYGSSEETSHSGAVRLLMDVRNPIESEHVLVVEDIVDTGHTLSYLLDMLEARHPASLRTCALVRKPDRAEVDVTVNYLGFDIPDVWAVGYGLDWAERYRMLPDICEVET